LLPRSFGVFGDESLPKSFRKKLVTAFVKYFEEAFDNGADQSQSSVTPVS
jgi:hypothetical protein